MDITYLIRNSHNDFILHVSTHDVWNRQGEIDYWYIVTNSLNSVIMFWPKVMDVLEVLFDVIDMATWYGGTLSTNITKSSVLGHCLS